jgi:hypothetical protein
MGKRRADASSRKFFDQFEKVKVSRFRAMGVIDPANHTAVIPFPNGTTKLIGTAHTRLKYGGGFSYFICPKCARRVANLYLIDDAPRCTRCCDAMNIKHAGQWGFGRETRRRAQDKQLDQLIAKLETKEPLRLKTPASWEGKAKRVYNSRKLTARMRRRMISLRLNQLASQQQKTNEGLKLTRAYTPRSEALIAIPELAQVWRANTHERLQQALDKAQIAILKALECEDPAKRLCAAKLMLNTKQARERGFTGLRT